MEYDGNPDTYYKRKGLVAKRKVRIDWVRKAIESCHTRDEWQELVRSMGPKDQVDALIRVQPKEIKGEIGSTVRILIEGLKAPALTARIVDPEALDAHVEGDVEEE